MFNNVDTSTSPPNTPRTLRGAGVPGLPGLVRAVLVSLVAALLVSAPGVAPASAESPAGGAPSVRTAKIASSRVGFDLVNTNNSSVLCLPLPDGKGHRVRGRLVGPKSVLSGRDAVVTINVLVHDAGTGGWFFNLRSNPTYDYARQLAERGQTSLVLDRLGYDRSPLKDGQATCLGAQVHMLHEVVQHLYAGRFDYLGSRSGATAPHASHVVLQGHGTGATIAQLEAARFDDVDALVLMAPTTTSPSQVALDIARGQAQTCLTATFAPYGDTSADYRKALFRTAPRAVRRAAVHRRNPTPCGDVASLPAALASSVMGDRDVEMPVLVLRAGADARRSGGTVAVTSKEKITRATFKGAGSALTLEKAAPKVQRTVVRWLRTL
ncbi:hypothetical protein BH09ACT12_BH09ACT12_00220 [soil metagenome]